MGGAEILKNLDLALYSPFSQTRKISVAKDSFVIGTVKGLKPVYGIDNLLYAVKKALDKRPEMNINVRIAGRGSQEDELYKITQKLHLENIVQWLGFISQEDAAEEWANMDLAVIPSYQESFGVAAIEAVACGTDIIVSNAEGLVEVTKPFLNDDSIFQPDDIDKLCNLIIQKYFSRMNLSTEQDKRRSLVKEKYGINESFERVESLYSNYKRGNLSCKN